MSTFTLLDGILAFTIGIAATYFITAVIIRWVERGKVVREQMRMNADMLNTAKKMYETADRHRQRANGDNVVYYQSDSTVL